MKTHNKPFIGGLVTILVGTSCCWISGLLIWLGAGTILGSVIHWLEIKQPLIIGIGIGLMFVSLILYLRYQRNKKRRYE